MTTSSAPAASNLRFANGTAALGPGTYDFDPVHTFVGFKARHLIVGSVGGRFNDVRGTILVGEAVGEAKIEAVVSAASIDTMNAARDDDLKGEHFLDAARFPTLTYRSTRIEHAGGGEWSILGTLSVRDIERPVVLALSFLGAIVDPSGRTRAGFTATAHIRRAEFGISWELLKELGPVAAGPDIAIHIEAEAVLREQT